MIVTCKKCKRDLPESDYHPSRLKKPPFYCRECLHKDFRKRVPAKGRKSIKVEKSIIDKVTHYKTEHGIKWLDPTLLSYCAGIIDGEGSILITKGKQSTGDGYSYEIAIGVHMMDGAIPKLFSECFGGKYSSSIATHANSKGEYVYRWRASGATARTVLELTSQYLKIKLRLAELAMYFHDHLLSNPKRKKITPEMLEKRESMRLLANKIRHTPVNEVQYYD